MINIINFNDHKRHKAYAIPDCYLENVCKELDIASAVLVYYDPVKGFPAVDAFGVNEVGAELLIKMAYYDIVAKINAHKKELADE